MAAREERVSLASESVTSGRGLDPRAAAFLQRLLNEAGEPAPKELVRLVLTMTGLPTLEQAEVLIEEILRANPITEREIDDWLRENADTTNIQNLRELVAEYEEYLKKQAEGRGREEIAAEQRTAISEWMKELEASREGTEKLAGLVREGEVAQPLPRVIEAKEEGGISEGEVVRIGSRRRGAMPLAGTGKKEVIKETLEPGGIGQREKEEEPSFAEGYGRVKEGEKDKEPAPVVVTPARRGVRGTIGEVLKGVVSPVTGMFGEEKETPEGVEEAHLRPRLRQDSGGQVEKEGAGEATPEIEPEVLPEAVVRELKDTDEVVKRLETGGLGADRAKEIATVIAAKAEEKGLTAAEMRKEVLEEVGESLTTEERQAFLAASTRLVEPLPAPPVSVGRAMGMARVAMPVRGKGKEAKKGGGETKKEPGNIEISETAARIAKTRLAIDYSTRGFWGLLKHTMSQAASPITGVAAGLWVEADEAEEVELPAEVVEKKKELVEVQGVLETQIEKVPVEQREAAETAVKLLVMYGVGTAELTEVTEAIPTQSDLPVEEAGRLAEELNAVKIHAAEIERENPELVREIRRWFGPVKVSWIRTGETVDKERTIVEFLRPREGGLRLARPVIWQAPPQVKFILGQVKGWGMKRLRTWATPLIKRGLAAGAKWLGKLGLKLGLKGGGIAAGEALAGGLLGGPLGAVVTFVGGKVLGRVWGFIKRVAKNLFGGLGVWLKKQQGREGVGKWWLPAGLVGGGVLLMPALPVLGVVMAGAGLVAGGVTLIGSAGAAIGGALAGAGAAISAVTGAVTGAAFPALGAALIGVGGAVGLTYVQTEQNKQVLMAAFTGPGEAVGYVPGHTSESEHMIIQKVASTTCLGRSGCPDLNTAVEYEVTITARRATLTGLTIEGNEYRVTGEGEGRGAPNPSLPTLPATIEAGQSHRFSYSVNLSAYNNSVVVDTIRVAGQIEVEGGQPITETVADSAAVTIGEPPISAGAEELAAMMLDCYGSTITDSNWDGGACLAGRGVRQEVINAISESVGVWVELQCVGLARAILQHVTGIYLPSPPGGDAWSYNCGSNGCSPVNGFTFYTNFSQVRPGDMLIFGSRYAGGTAGSIAYVTSVSGLAENRYICTVHANIGGRGDIHINDCYYAQGTPYLTGYLRPD